MSVPDDFPKQLLDAFRTAGWTVDQDGIAILDTAAGIAAVESLVRADERARLTPQLQWARGMCTDELPHEQIDQYLAGLIDRLTP